MTKTTVNRQISLLVQGIFSHYKIDNFAAEIDLVNALQRMLNESNKDPARMVKIREDILAGMLAQGKQENVRAEMEGRVKACLGISIDGRSRYESMIRFLVDMDEKGQKVETYAEWCKNNPMTAPKPFQISIRPALLEETWTIAFPVPKIVTAPTGTVQTDAQGITVSW